MQRKKPDVDVVNDVLLKAIAAYPENAFVKSLHYQYHERGGLSKKQLEGLFQKGSRTTKTCHIGSADLKKAYKV